jgi:RNA polymerase sigma-70 factor (ECF subfamily)
MGPTGATLHLTLQRALEAGSLQRWEDFVRESHGLVASAVFRALARWRTPQKDQVEDLVQEVFLKLCANDFLLLRRFRSDSSEALTAYLRTISGTIVMDAQRRHAAFKRGSGGETLDLDEVHDRAGSTESVETIERGMLLGRVGDCLSGQKDRDRQVFWLYYRQGLTSQAIAAIKAVNLTSRGVESLIRRLTIAVRKCLGVSASGENSRSAEGNSA